MTPFLSRAAYFMATFSFLSVEGTVQYCSIFNCYHTSQGKGKLLCLWMF